jgi:hypothetical protein
MKAVALMCLVSGVAVAAPHGKVVRIVRDRESRASNPRLCEIESSGKGTCLGPVHSGDLAIVVDAKSVVAQLRIDEVTIMQPSCPSLVSVQGKFQGNGSFQKAGPAFGIIDGDVDPVRGRLILETGTTPSPNGHDRVVIAIDRDGDQTADILMTQGACDAAGNSLPSGEPSCVDVWSRGIRGMTRVQHLNIASCR